MTIWSLAGNTELGVLRDGLVFEFKMVDCRTPPFNSLMGPPQSRLIWVQ